MRIDVYFSRTEGELNTFPLIISRDFHSEIIDVNFGYFKVKLTLSDNSKLFLFELVEVMPAKGKILKVYDKSAPYHHNSTW